MSEGVKTLADQVGGAARDHNTEREGKEGPAGTNTGSIGQMAVAGVEGETAGEIAIVENVPGPRLAVFEVEVGLGRPSEVVHGCSQSD